jgi:hypothetical protein
MLGWVWLAVLALSDRLNILKNLSMDKPSPIFVLEIIQS